MPRTLCDFMERLNDLLQDEGLTLDDLPGDCDPVEAYREGASPRAVVEHVLEKMDEEAERYWYNRYNNAVQGY